MASSPIHYLPQNSLILVTSSSLWLPAAGNELRQSLPMALGTQTVLSHDNPPQARR
jgi:hypothetical protein